LMRGTDAGKPEPQVQQVGHPDTIHLGGSDLWRGHANGEPP
jgi:hypothetical protein